MREAQMGYMRAVKDENREKQWKENWWIDCCNKVARRTEADGYSKRGRVHGPKSLMENPIMRMLWRRLQTFFEGVREVSMTFFRQQLSSLFICCDGAQSLPWLYSLYLYLVERILMFSNWEVDVVPRVDDVPDHTWLVYHSRKIVLFIVTTVRTSNQLY
jgi:hypothetical protein